MFAQGLTADINLLCRDTAIRTNQLRGYVRANHHVDGRYLLTLLQVPSLNGLLEFSADLFPRTQDDTYARATTQGLENVGNVHMSHFMDPLTQSRMPNTNSFLHQY